MYPIALLEQNPILLGTVTALFGLVAGSFLNVAIRRLPRILEREWRRECAALTGQESAELVDESPLSLAYPPSHCQHCGHRIRAIENIPVLSYLLLRGRCSACKSAIGLRYPLVEILTAVLSVLVVMRFGLSVESAAALVLTWGLIALAVIDLDTQLLPDNITLPLLWLGLLLSLGDHFTDTSSAILGASLGYLSLWTIFHVFRLVTGKEGMGFGDFKLFAVFGAWLGWQYLPQVILLSALAGALTGTAMILLAGRDSQAPLPFGPFLASAGWIALMWGDAINNAYTQWTAFI